MDRTYCSLLIVDDDAFNRDLLSRRLAREGYTVVTAETGRIAFDLLAHETFDLVLLDIMMPEIDGIEVLRRIRATPTLSQIPVMMVTALNSRENVLQCIELGANDYITKPFDMLLVKSRVWRCLEGGSYCEVRHKQMLDDYQGTVLVVDDNEANRDILSRRIRKFGHHHLDASNGHQALSLLREQPIDLVLLDINMPGLTGMDVLRTMKRNIGMKDIPVIMVSANTDHETMHACLELGADDYITKPFNSTILKSRMIPLLKIKQKTDLEQLRSRSLQDLSRLGEQFR